MAKIVIAVRMRPKLKLIPVPVEIGRGTELNAELSPVQNSFAATLGSASAHVQTQSDLPPGPRTKSIDRNLSHK